MSLDEVGRFGRQAVYEVDHGGLGNGVKCGFDVDETEV